MQNKVSVSFARWLKPYVHLLAVCAVLSGRVPDPDKLAAKVRRATIIRIR
ncbi:hypothetical protein [Paraburkholderia tuberum]|uniref:Uncharacterized protein n=1 Tax=Paraburkholderia tuberum TaxID=157910 RepID=A0A1H1JB20_9BURK|nr:hypothetical protein [Paraburkholderia tuberum]SDR47184.1 hypothetical protein SAMN05445850_4519 [Paraburkholderia tuberum]